MEQNKDDARGPEVFVNDRYSVTPGTKYIYHAHKLYDPETQVVTGWHVYESINANEV